MHVPRTFTIVAAIALALAVPAVLIGGEPAESADAAAAPAEETNSAPGAPVFEHDVESYTVRASPSGDADADLVISVVPKAPFHINVAYPWKFTSEDNTYKADAFALTEAEARLPLEAAESGELRFSVCNDETCLIEKVSVAAADTATE